MVRLSKLTDYGLVLMSHIAQGRAGLCEPRATSQPNLGCRCPR